MIRKIAWFTSVAVWFAATAFGQSSDAPPSLTVKYVTTDVVYINGGTAAGLLEDMRLLVKRPTPGQSPLTAETLAELKVISVASASAVCEIINSSGTIQPNDIALISPEDRQAMQERALTASPEAYAQLVEFSVGDPLEEEIREYLPKPTLREVNRISGRIGVEYGATIDRAGAPLRSEQEGLTFRFDLTRIGNSHWSLAGYWRARLTRQTRSTTTLNDLLQRVYHIGLRYENPDSRYVAGVGRLLVPWASSLSTVDGGYFGRKLGGSTTIGVFGGSTPDPTSWNYAPNRQMGGSFLGVETGSFERARYTVTVGVALSRIKWKPERQFLFAENSLIFKRRVSVHHSLEADYQSHGDFSSTKKVDLTRSYLTLRVQPISRLSLEASHNYFRILPTFDPALVSVGLLDSVLFQGLTSGARFDFPGGVSVYGSAGRSKRSGEVTDSWNRMGGLNVRIPGVGLRGDFRYSKFAGTFGDGQYRTASLVKDGGERFRSEVQIGDQVIQSTSSLSKSRYGMGSFEVFLGRFVLGGSATRHEGDQRYDQFLTHLDFRFFGKGR